MPATDTAETNDGRHDFDFIFGDWNVHNRKLRDVTGPDCEEWLEFATTAHAEPMFGGEDTRARRPIILRFHWTNPAPGRARWTQEFSPDNGRIWQLNWVMDLTAADNSPANARIPDRC